MGNKISVLTGNEAELGLRLHQLTEEENFDEIIRFFDKIHCEEGCTMAIQRYDPNSETADEEAGARSHVIITRPDGTVYDDEQPEFWRCIKIDETPEAIWQVVLLYNLWYNLPLYWHAIYALRTYLYKQEDFEKIFENFRNHGRDLGSFNEKDYEISPKIRIDEEGKYHITVYYWTNFGGFHRECFIVYVEKSESDTKGQIQITCTEEKCLYRYTPRPRFRL